MKRIREFGGKKRVHVTDDILNNIADTTFERLSDDEQEAVELIKEGFKELTQIQREIFGLISEGKTLEQIAKTLGMQIGTTRTHYMRAKNKLRKYVLQHAEGSIYIESMLRGTVNEKEDTGD